MFTYLIISNKTYLAVIATAQLLEFWASQITNSKKHKLDWNPVLSSNFSITNLLSWDLVYQGVIYVTFIFIVITIIRISKIQVNVINPKYYKISN